MQFNDFFNNNSDYQSGMTGTDIMEQLDDIAIMVAIEDSIKTSNTRTTEDRKNIQQALARFYASHNGPAVIHGVSFKNPKLATTTEIDALCDKCLAYKSKVTT